MWPLYDLGTEVSNDEISDAIERVMAGPEKKDRVMSERRKRLVAYHEAGHALVGALMPDYDPVQKISIIPRGNAGGLTFFTPSEERMESPWREKVFSKVSHLCLIKIGSILKSQTLI